MESHKGCVLLARNMRDPLSVHPDRVKREKKTGLLQLTVRPNRAWPLRKWDWSAVFCKHAPSSNKEWLRKSASEIQLPVCDWPSSMEPRTCLPSPVAAAFVKAEWEQSGPREAVSSSMLVSDSEPESCCRLSLSLSLSSFNTFCAARPPNVRAGCVGRIHRSSTFACEPSPTNNHFAFYVPSQRLLG